jgi:prevent-host-death family protein
MKAVGIRELKAKLSEYVRLVRSGEVVLVTDRGEVVAELSPPRTTDRIESDESGLDDLVTRGLITRGAPNDPAVYRRMPRIAPDGTAQRLIDEERGER